MSAILVKSFVGQAEAYFEKELTNKRETYYSERGTTLGQWTGKGAEALGLKGDIKKEDFSQMSRGVNPNTGERFRRMTLGRMREVNGEIKQVKEIAGWDMVISAPKSVSIAGLIGQDERVRTAHQESVTDALDRAEQQAQSNNGGGKKEQTNNLIVGRFQHDSARPSRDGFVAPQLHDHCFIMNATLRTDGTIKPLESLELHKAQSYIKSVYYTGLADRLQKLGYAVEIDKETGAPEIAGISKEYRAACSPRRAEILELAEKAGKNFRQLGLVNRREKIFDKDLIQEQHRGIDGLFDYQAKRVVETARITPPPTGKPDLAKEAVTFALTKLSERESVFNPRVVLLEANKRGIGQTSVAAIEAEFETRKKEEKVKTVRLRDGQEAVFLSSDEKIENELPQHIKAVQPKQTLQDEILTTKLSENSRAAVNTEFLKLSDEQQSAVKEILTAKTGVVTLEGRAGVGKTTTLSFVNKIAEKANYEVLGLAPTTGAAQELDNAQITSATLQKLLASQDTPRDHKRFFIVDESSFVSSRQMDKFFREAVKTGDRVLLVGDTRQHEGVEAGKPFARIQREELTTGAKVETIRRQTKETDRETVKNLSEGKIIEAVEAMRQRGQVVEVKDRAERHDSIVEAFTREPEKSLVVAPRNADRQEINSKIHEALKDAGKVGKAETEIKILRPRNELSGTEREFAAAYREGDVISYTRGSAENNIAAKSLAKVVKTDREQNLLTVEIKDGRDGAEAREVTYNPKRLRGVSVWTEEKIKVSEGDRLQLRAPFEERQTKIANGTMLEVSKITPDALSLTTDKGKAVKLDTERPHAIDYGYAVTSHSSQGKTIDRVLIHAETSESKQILNERMAYVAVSRARDEALIFTDDADKLAGKMARQIEKTDISQVKAETIKFVPERAAEIVLDTQSPVEKTDRSEIRQPIILPSVEILTRPAIVIESTQQSSVVSEVKPETEPKEIKPSAIVPLVEKSSTPIIEIQSAPEDVFPTGYTPTDHQKILIKELVQLSRTSAEQQGLFHSEKAWSWLETVKFPDLGARETPENHKRFVDFLQEDLPESERVNLSGKSEIESTHAILKQIPTEKRETIVNGFFADYYKPQNEGERIIEHAPELAEKNVSDTKPEIKRTERGEIKQPIILPTVEKPTPETKIQPARENVIADDPKKRQENLLKEVLQLSRDSLAKQGIEPNAEVWKLYADDLTNDAPHRESPAAQLRLLKYIQEETPKAEQVSLEGISRLEATHLTLKLLPENVREKFVASKLASCEREIKAEREEIKQPIQTTVEKPAVTEIKSQQPERKIITTGGEPKVSQETLIKEVLQMSRDSLAKQGIEPQPEAWKRFANTVINDLPNQKAHESQERTLESLQKDAPPSERVSATGKTSLEATHAILKLVPENQRDEIVKGTLARCEKQIAAERGDMVVELELKAERIAVAVKPAVKITTPEIVETAKTTPVEKPVVEPVKPLLKVRNFETIEREKLIGELVAAASDEARAWKGEDLSYRQERRLTKMYREVGDRKPSDKQVKELDALQNRFSEPMPPPKNFLEATVLKLDNITDAKKSASLRGQLTKLDELIEREELQKAGMEKPFGQAVEGDVFGREDDYFVYQLYRLNMKPEGKSYFDLMREAQERNLLTQSYNVSEKMQEQQMQQAVYQMGIANALQERIKKSFDEQGLKLEPLAQRIVNNTIDIWAKQPPTAEEYKSVQDINQSSGRGVMPESRLEAKAYIFTQSEEKDRDQVSYSLAKAAGERAEEVKQTQQARKQEKSIEVERDYEERSQGRSM